MTELRAEIPYGMEDETVDKLIELIEEKNGQKLYELKYIVTWDKNGDGESFFFDENLEEIEIIDLE